MPRRPRSEQIDAHEVGIYHCVNRCVRRAFLCGVDRETGRSYEHRREWIERRLEFLAGVMGIDVLTYAVMSNHVHVILRNRPDVVEGWSEQQVRERWWQVCPLRRNEDGSPAEPTEVELLALVPEEKLKVVRDRLSSISWLMRFLCENVARRANHEDDVTGRFWEGRFKCQPLLDESAVLACSMYVDLNPIRAKEAATPETSRFTSAFTRIQALTRRDEQDTAAWLAPVALNDRAVPTSTCRASDKGFLPMTLSEYLRLLDWTGRQARRDKRGTIPPDLKPLLERLRIIEGTWVATVLHFGRWFRSAAGRAANMTAAATRTRRRWLHGTTMSRSVFQQA